MADEPETVLGVLILSQAYSELSTCRSIGMALGPIPWTAMVAWSQHHRLSTPATNNLVAVLMRVDQETLRREASRNKTPTKRSDNGG